MAVATGTLAGQAVEVDDCTASAASLDGAQQAYADSCSQPRVDCDPIDDQWVCSSQVIGLTAPNLAGDQGAPMVPPASTTNPPAPPAAPAPAPPPAGGGAAEACGVIAFEAESLDLAGGWRRVEDSGASGGSYITWEGLSREANNNQPADTLSHEIQVSVPGTYRFTWAMRQPSGVESDKANDTWLNVPGADRFGPTSGGSYQGFIKVFGNSTGNFAYRATADVNHNKTDIAIVFGEAGTYTVQIAGRSHGHQIDRVVLYQDSISLDDAVAADACGDGGTAPQPPAAPAQPPAAPAPPADGGGSGVPGDAPFDAARDLVSLHYDHAPDKDDGHATVAGREVTSHFGITPWVIGGSYGAGNRNTYNSASEQVMTATWGDGWVNAHADWDAAVQRTADRWEQTLRGGGDVWVAEGGQSDLSADVVRELKSRNIPGFASTSDIHIVQHSEWNERMTEDGDLAYVRAETDYSKIEDGNDVNATADLNLEDYRGPFTGAALGGPHAAGWRAAFDYYSPNQRLDFSDTVELLHILGVGKDDVSTINDFAGYFLN